MLSNKKLGDWGEDLACDFLRKNGYRILERNFRTRIGEIDIITEKKGKIIFIEVKTKKGINFGLPEEMVGKRKQEKLIKLAQLYLAQKNLIDKEFRIDVVAIERNKENGKTKIRLIKNAVFQ